MEQTANRQGHNVEQDQVSYHIFLIGIYGAENRKNTFVGLCLSVNWHRSLCYAFWIWYSLNWILLDIIRGSQVLMFFQ